MNLLNEHDAAFVQIDEPKFKTSIRQNQLPNITSFYYLRAHGRNWKKWWHHEQKDERYDYLYKPGEIQAFGETLKAVKKIVRKAYGYIEQPRRCEVGGERDRAEALPRRGPFLKTCTRKCSSDTWRWGW